MNYLMPPPAMALLLPSLLSICTWPCHVSALYIPKDSTTRRIPPAARHNALGFEGKRASSHALPSSASLTSLTFSRSLSRTTHSATALNIINGDTFLDLSKYTVVELKSRLREANLPVSGRKNELIERLNEYYSTNDDAEARSADEDEDMVEVAEEMGINDNAMEGLELEQDLRQLTVAALKDRLRERGLPLGGRKHDLIERLQASVDTPPKDTLPGEQYSDHLEDILPDLVHGDDDDDGGNELDASFSDETINNLLQLGNFDADKSPSSHNQNDLARRARRKKYWKTQEVRELIRANDPRAPAKAEEMISVLECMAAEENNEDYLPGPTQYTALIDAYARSGKSDAPQRAEKVIARIMAANEQANRTLVSPTAAMSNAIMVAYANLGTPEAAEQASAILERMEYLKDFGDGSVKLSVYSYSVAISAWARCATPEAALRAEHILNRLFDVYEELLASDQESGYAEELRPNTVVFNSVIDAWARSGSPSAGAKAEALLNKMEELSKKHEYDIRPDVISFNTCIKAWCNTKNEPDAPQKAENILSKLETYPQYPRKNGMATVRPNRLSYNCVIDAWAKSQSPESATRAQDLLMRMIKSFRKDLFVTIKPDVVSFSSVLNALAKSKTVRFKAEKCLAILKSMIELHEEDGTYDTKPNIICYNTVLNSCAFSALSSNDERRQALTVAVETFHQLRIGKYASPDAVSYGNMIKCCANLMPTGDARTEMASRLFTSCCNEGMVGGMVLDEIRRAIPSTAFLQLLADRGYDKPLIEEMKASDVQLRHLPRGWTVNVKAGDMASRQRGSHAKPKTSQGRKKRRRSDRRRDRRMKPTPPKSIRPMPRIVEIAWTSGKDV